MMIDRQTLIEELTALDDEDQAELAANLRAVLDETPQPLSGYDSQIRQRLESLIVEVAIP